MRQIFEKRKTVRLQTWITLLVGVVLIIALAVTGILIAGETAETVRESQAEKTMDIAHTVSQSPLVIEGLSDEAHTAEIQAYTKAVQEDTDVAYIVVMDSERLRQSHPVEERIGEYFVGDDEDRAFQGEHYTSVAEGTLGESLRAFVPIWDREELVGVVSVGILLDKVEDTVITNQRIIYLGTGAGLIVGVIGAVFLARRVKRTMHGLEPREIAHLLQERGAMLASVREGIIAVNEKAEIVVANHAALELFQRAGLAGDPVGQEVDAYLPPSRLREVLLNEKIEYDQEQRLHGIDIVVNKRPVELNDQMVGAIATFRDKSELTSLAAQLTNAKTYADTLRGQTHEFMNQLHVLSAMVETESYNELQTYIKTITPDHQQATEPVSRLVKDPVLAGYILNKLSQLRENNVTIELNGEKALPLLIKKEKMDVITTVIGNVLENANEAMANQPYKYVMITINYINKQMYVSIQDNGPGLLPSEMETIFEKGKSTKGDHRGYGLFLAKQKLDEWGGTLELSSEKGEGTVFDLVIPYEGDDV